MDLTVGIIIFIFAVISLGVGYCIRCERLLWNNGVCPDCNSRWERSDADMTGGRGYKCPCGNHIIIFGAVDKTEAA